MSIFINGQEFDVSLDALQREATILNGDNAGQLKNGNMVRDVIGTIYNYGLEVSPSHGNLTAYNGLYEAITAPVDSLVVALPFGQGNLEFEAYIDSADDSLWHIGPGLNLWDKLHFTVIPKEPQRYYGEIWAPGTGSGNGVFTLDGIEYSASVSKLERSGKVQSRAKTRSISGVTSRETKGTFYNYSIAIDRDNIAEYDRLYYALTAPVDGHAITIPYGDDTLVFQAYITTVRDNLEFADDRAALWGGLEVDFIAMAPARR